MVELVAGVEGKGIPDGLPAGRQARSRGVSFEASTDGNEPETGPATRLKNFGIELLNMKFYKVSWKELETDCFALYKKIKKYKFDRILCVSRGGLVWARMFSDLLGNLPISHLTAVSYTGIHKQKNVEITELPEHKKLNNQTLLVVDEIADHGKTFAKVKEYLRTLKIKKYYTLAPIIRTYIKPRPDFYLKIIDDWIIYPYELKETYKAFLKIYKTKEKALKMLLKNGFKEDNFKGLF